MTARTLTSAYNGRHLALLGAAAEASVRLRGRDQREVGPIRLTLIIALVLGGLFGGLAVEAQEPAKVARVGYLLSSQGPPACERPSVKDCVTSVTSRAATS